MPIDVSPASYSPGVSLARGSFTSDPVIPAGSGASRLWRKWILVVVILSLSGLESGVRRLAWDAGAVAQAFCSCCAHARAQNKNRGHSHAGQTQINTLHSVHHFSSQGFFSGSDGFLLQHRLHNSDFGSLPIVRVRREVEQFGILPRSRRIEQILHHDQRTIVMLNHSCQKQMVELRAFRLPQRVHLLRRQHSRHKSHRMRRMIRMLVHVRHFRSGMSGIAMEIGSPRVASHRCINLISSDCELLIRAPSDRKSLFSVCDAISAVISTACE